MAEHPPRRQATSVSFTPRSFDAAATTPLHRQLYDALREAILAGQLRPGARLPATRALGAELGLSRTTIVAAFEQLQAEGYIEGRSGSGTYVADLLPDTLLRPAPLGRRAGDTGRARGISQRGRLLLDASAGLAPGPGAARPFAVGVPAMDRVPWRIWGEIEHRLLRRRGIDFRSYTEPAGYGPLRRAIADYLSAARAVRCIPEQVIIVAGSQQALDLVARVLLDPGDAAWVEDPGYARATAALAAAGARLIPVPVDAHGLDVEAGIGLCPSARLAYVTPSHQFPLGMTMSLARRLALLGWANASEAWVLEDDYDSEFRYAGRPLACLQGLDEAGRVLYTGAFSKVLFPGLRLGYLVVPPDLIEAFARAREMADLGAPVLAQAVVAALLTEGHFGRHLRRMRALYAARQTKLLEIVRRELAGMVDVAPAPAGMHLLGWLPPDADDRALAEAAAAAGVVVLPLSAYARTLRPPPALLLGYAAFSEQQMAAGIARLAGVLVEWQASARV